MKKKQNGFTLVELSIVLIIIGLLVGGVVAGKELIKAAERNQLITKGSTYVAAANTFYIKYGYFPGDQPDATDYGFSVLNGNGDDKITDSSGTTGESQWAWVVLSESGMIKGQYTYILNDPVVGVNVPSAMGGEASFALSTGWLLYAVSEYADHNAIFISNTRPNGWYGSGTAYGAGLTPLDAQTIDTKLDDGMPGSGKVISHLGRGESEVWITTCHSRAGAPPITTTTYDLTTAPNTISCRLARVF